MADRLINYLLYRMTLPQAVAHITTYAGLIAWARHTNRNGGTR
ncbi:hypothetical protein ABT010_13170 [Streptomyces sp. NPDC002668]